MANNLITIVADSAAEALAEIHRQLGPNAIVVNVRKTNAPGLSGIWKKGKIEVQATLPSAPAPAQKQEVPRPAPIERPSANPGPARLPKFDSPALAARRRTAPKVVEEQDQVRESKTVSDLASTRRNGNWDLGKMLENLGILPLHAQWLVDQVRSRQADTYTNDLRDEFRLVQGFLVQYWERLAARTRNVSYASRILVGFPGVGKTTCLCKWLTQEVLLRGQPARVWRLDTHTANTAEFLSIHGEILGIPVERIWTDETTTNDTEMQFVDLPGVVSDNPEAMTAVTEQIKLFPSPQVLLVLNAAYDLDHLLHQARTFASLPLGGIILSHLDEDKRWGKFWNLLLGTKLPILYLSGGQNIPGQFSAASPQSLFEVLPDQSKE